MWNRTKAAELLGIKYPIIQGPFGGKFSSARLVATVSNLGGMGSFGLNAYSPEEILSIDAEIKALTDKPYALNLWVPLKDDPAEKYRTEDFDALRERFKPYFEELNVPLPEMPTPQVRNFEHQVEAVLQAKPPVASFIFGIPSKEILLELKQAGIITVATATTVEEALCIEEAAIDLIVASGFEAGGHRASFLKPAEESLTGTFPLVLQVVAKVKIPIIAAGGISDGRSIFSALTIGASAVQIGTAFLATEEANASEAHKARLLNNPVETILTKVYTGRLARVISNAFSKDFENSRNENFAPYPIQSAFLTPLRQAATAQNKLYYEAFWSGQPSTILTHKSAATLFNTLVKEVSSIHTVKSSKSPGKRK